ncbi:MAG: polyphenol oxidase family protein [Gemmatimonadales bacterium]|nr:polyphenol oxidase family protein [Gemmatimonadales bacterium]
MTATVLRELPVAGEVPRLEVPGWRERFGVIAGITTRGDAPGAGFDLGLWSTQPVGDVMRRWQALRASESCLRAAVLGTQVHGTRVAWHEGGLTGWTQLDGVDGHATDRSGLMLCVTVADCIPVYLLAPSHGGLALLHAGWRGIAGGILERGVEVLSSRVRCEPFDIVMHCGVGISGEQYEVGREVMDGLGEAAPEPGPWRVDLRAVLARRGAALGLGEVTVSDHCSARDAGRFFSHRRSAGRDGRMVAYLGAKP